MILSDIIASIALIISFLTMVAAFRDISLSNKANTNLQRITLRLDFSHRYQEIMLAMSDSGDPDRIRKYVLLYFDLCSEEYRLWKSGEGIVDSKTWHLWEDGMRDLMEAQPTYRDIWNASKENYKSISDTSTNNFHAFFDSLVQESDRT